MVQSNPRSRIEQPGGARSPTVVSATGRPTAEVEAGLADATSALDRTPLVAHVIFLPIMATGATVADITSALTTSSIHAGRNLAARGLSAIGWG